MPFSWDKLQKAKSLYFQINTTYILIDGNIESNPEPTQNNCKSYIGRPKKIKLFKGTVKKCDLRKNKVNVASDPNVQFFSIWFNHSA